MDTGFISFRKTSDDEEEISSSDQEEEQQETEDGSYNIEDILKRTAASLKKQLDRLELYVVHQVWFRTHWISADYFCSRFLLLQATCGPHRSRR